MSNQQGEVMNPMFSNMPNDTGFVPSPVPYGPVNSWSGNAMNTMRNGMTGMQTAMGNGMTAMGNRFTAAGQGIQSRAYSMIESEKSSGGVKATLIIIMILVFIGCGILIWYKKFEPDTFTVGTLIFLNSIAVLGMGLALMYGMGKGKRDSVVVTGGGDDFFSTSYDLELTDL